MVVYGLFILVVGYIGFRLVQWFIWVEQFRQQGRDIQKEMERLFEMNFTDKERR